jgi:hypothetical protein
VVSVLAVEGLCQDIVRTGDDLQRLAQIVTGHRQQRAGKSLSAWSASRLRALPMRRVSQPAAAADGTASRKPIVSICLSSL